MCAGMLSVCELDLLPFPPLRALIFSFLKQTPQTGWHVKLVAPCDNSEDTGHWVTTDIFKEIMYFIGIRISTAELC